MNRARLDIHRVQYLKAAGTMEDCGLTFVISDDYFTEEVEPHKYILEVCKYTRDEKRNMIEDVLVNCSGQAVDVLANDNGLLVIDDHFTKQEVLSIMENYKSENY